MSMFLISFIQNIIVQLSPVYEFLARDSLLRLNDNPTWIREYIFNVLNMYNLHKSDCPLEMVPICDTVYTIEVSRFILLIF